MLWLELLTVSHITGRRAPDPDRAWIASLRRSFDDQTLECAVAHRIQAAVDEANKSVSKAEAIKKFTVLANDFTEAGGEITPSLKLKRNVVSKNYANDIESLYKK